MNQSITKKIFLIFMGIILISVMIALVVANNNINEKRQENLDYDGDERQMPSGSYIYYEKLEDSYYEGKNIEPKSKEEIKQIAYRYLLKSTMKSEEYELTEFSNDGHENYYGIQYNKKISGYIVGQGLFLEINILGELCSINYPKEDERFNAIKEISIDEEKLYKYIEENMQTDHYDEYEITDARFGFNKEGIFEAQYGIYFDEYSEFNGEEIVFTSATTINIPYYAIKKDDN